METFSDQLRHWRRHRRMSQLDLALAANVSARHISFLETGRSRPSRDMTAHLGEVLDMPLDAINRMLLGGGFAPRYAATPLDAESLAPVVQAVRWTLDRHAPYPGLAIDREWRVRMINAPARALFAPLGLEEGDSLLELMSGAQVPGIIENWPEVAHHTAIRLRAESAAAGGVAVLDRAAEKLTVRAAPVSAASGPTVPMILRVGKARLALFSTLAQFTTAADTTLDDLRIELFFPADDESAAALRAFSSTDQR